MWISWQIEPPVIQHPPELIPVETASGWYLRGDIGYSFNRAPDARWRGTNFFNESVGDTYVVGAGFGYKLNEYFRTDLTVDYHGKYSFDTFTHLKSVFRQSFAFDIDFRYPPYFKNLQIYKWALKLFGS